MKMMLKAMQKKNSGIPKDVLPVFEGIVQKYAALNAPSLGHECNAEFVRAMETHLTKEQRFGFYEKHGGCNGTGHDKERKAFAHEHAHLPLAERLELFESQQKLGLRDGSIRETVLNDDNTITLTFACTHGYYRYAREGKSFTPPASLQTYFESCAGGRLYELEKALGIKLKIKSADISPLSENARNPVIFTFDIVG